MRSFVLVVALSILSACGGSTVSESDPDAGTTSSAICGSLADSGIHFAQCIATECCDALNVCAQSKEGLAYETCVLNCSWDADGGRDSAGGIQKCTDSCRAMHPDGVTACSPYLDCFTMNCSRRN